MTAGAFVIITGVRNPRGTRIVHAAMQKQYTVQSVRNHEVSPLRWVYHSSPLHPTVLPPHSCHARHPYFLTCGALWRRRTMSPHWCLTSHDSLIPTPASRECFLSCGAAHEEQQTWTTRTSPQEVWEASHREKFILQLPLWTGSMEQENTTVRDSEENGLLWKWKEI